MIRIPREKDTVQRIRAKLREMRPDETLWVRCFNKPEVEEVKAQLTPEELSRIAKFSWLTFGGHDGTGART